MEAAAIIVAAGSGSRFGSALPKQFQQLGAKPVWKWSYDCLIGHPRIKEVVVVTPKDEKHAIPDTINKTIGGNTRTESVINGLSALNFADDTAVLIHDAARPGLSYTIIDALLDALSNSDGAAPALAINDALKMQADTLLSISRENLYRVQTPQAFRLSEIKEALQLAGEALADDLEAMQRAGKTISLVEGSRRLEKITHPGDLEWMERLLIGADIRTGTGFDVHAFEPGDHVVLCGVKIPHSGRLKGHSDADVGWHAITDAVLGALALGDIGDHFPPDNDKWRDVASSVFLKHAGMLVEEHGYIISNIDLTLICEAPKIKPHREGMRKSTANCLGISLDRVSVKATTTEQLGFTGRKEGIAAQASVTLIRS